MADFSKAKVGQKLWSLRLGEVVVRSHANGLIQCGAWNSCSWWTMEGRFHTDDVTPDLYWSKPEIIEPPQPKEKKLVKRWLNIYRNNTEYSPGHLNETMDEAKMKAKGTAIATVPIEFEVEE